METDHDASDSIHRLYKQCMVLAGEVSESMNSLVPQRTITRKTIEAMDQSTFLPLSQSLPANPYTEQIGATLDHNKISALVKASFSDYNAVLSEYESDGGIKILEMLQRNGKRINMFQKHHDFDTFSFPDETMKDRHGFGWKIHLNVIPQNVRKVATYLLEHGYHHKYLNGGSAQEGKIFTVYIGSRDLCLQEGKIISHDLFDFLSRPAYYPFPNRNDENEIAPGVVCRFDVGHIQNQCFSKSADTEFSRYGSCGFGLLEEHYKRFLKGVDSTSLIDFETFAFSRLQEKYGEYFSGR